MIGGTGLRRSEPVLEEKHVTTRLLLAIRGLPLHTAEVDLVLRRL